MYLESQRRAAKSESYIKKALGVDLQVDFAFKSLLKSSRVAESCVGDISQNKKFDISQKFSRFKRFNESEM